MPTTLLISQVRMKGKRKLAEIKSLEKIRDAIIKTL